MPGDNVSSTTFPNCSAWWRMPIPKCGHPRLRPEEPPIDWPPAAS